MMTSILITGAGKGIGRSTALAFAKRRSESFKPKLILTSRTEADLASLQAACALLGVETEIFTANLATDFDLIAQRAGAVDVLINNAGVGRFKDFSDLTPDDYDTTMDTNLKGTFFLTQKIFAQMQHRKSGHIFFVTSVAAETPFEQSALYCMSKFGQKGFIDVLRLYARKCNVRITNVMPGATYTPMWGNVPNETIEKMMQPDDIAEAIVDAYFQPARTGIEEIVLRPVGGDL
jgi:sepiapterin reductase